MERRAQKYRKSKSLKKRGCVLKNSDKVEVCGP